MSRLPPDVQRSIEKQIPRLLKRDLDTEFKKKFEELKQQMISEFLQHPVTMELSQGPSGTNISGTLGGVMNLFAFIGFPADYNPIQPILTMLQQTSYKFAGDGKMSRRYTVFLPQPKDVFDVTPMPWATGRSWAKGIETGISGLGFLLSKGSSNSRSGVAIQGSKQVRGGKFRNLPYITSILKKYEKEFNKLK